MSFSLTTDQVRCGEKDVTRRQAWWFLEEGELVRPVLKCMGLKKGEKVQPIRGPIRILSTRREPINKITAEDVRREGFPTWTPKQFIKMYTKHNRCSPLKSCNRIEFEYTD